MPLNVSVAEHKKAWGQYFTPPQLAEFAADLVADGATGTVRVLDPGAGTGTLGLALARALLERREVRRVELCCVESEPLACRELTAAVSAASVALGRRLVASVLDRDFLELRDATLPAFDVVIANPPYFKLSPKDPRGGDAPNVYARFMEAGAALLRDGGRLCFIVPRSYASGRYFRRFRRRFHAMMQLEHVHVFESRNAAFKADQVLQENVVVRYVKRPRAAADRVTISVSRGLDDLDARRTFSCASQHLISTDDDAVLSLPTDLAQLELMQRMQALPHTLDSLGLQISTGPVVAFRAANHLTTTNHARSTAPMLWLQHVRAGQIRWPLGAGFRKPEHIDRRAGAKLLVRAGNYVLLRRFSAKEDRRRLTAAPWLAADWNAPCLGLENHLNYIHRPAGALSVHEAHGLSALLNSRVLDDYFRITSGNTQVSATEIRALPLPSRRFIERLGRAAKRRGDVETMVDSLLESGVE